MIVHERLTRLSDNISIEQTNLFVKTFLKILKKLFLYQIFRRDTLEQLRAFLKSEEPKLVRFLLWVSEQQQKDSSYKTLGEACLSGELKISELKTGDDLVAHCIKNVEAVGQGFSCESILDILGEL